MTSTPKPNRAPLTKEQFRLLFLAERKLRSFVEPQRRGKHFRIRKDIHFYQVASEVATLKRDGYWRRFYKYRTETGTLLQLRNVPIWSWYCARYLPFPRRYADRLCKIDAVYTALTVATFGKPEYAMLKPAEIAWLPTHEKHCEALATFDADLWVPIWEAVKSSGKRITEALVVATGASLARSTLAQVPSQQTNAETPEMAF